MQAPSTVPSACGALTQTAIGSRAQSASLTMTPVRKPSGLIVL
jgi:hypothetical protein